MGGARSKGLGLMVEGFTRSEPEQARRTLSGGILVFRWLAFVWMVALNLARLEPLRHAAVAWLAISAAGLWTVWLTVNRGHDERAVLWFDLALSTGLILAANYVVRGGLFFATAYPASTALAWGAAGGVPRALVAAGILAAALALSRPIGGLGLGDFDRSDVLSLVNGIVYFLLAGLATGVVARHLDRQAAHLRSAVDDAIRSRERAARLAERESLARAIHDSVLQALARMHALGRELGQQAMVPGDEVRRIGDLARDQEQALRTLIVREPEEPPAGTASLRESLEAGAREVSGIPVTVSAVGPIWLPAGDVELIAAATRQALQNVIEHAGGTHAWVFADSEDGWVTVSIRDDGVGFVFDEAQLERDGKAGILKSMKGRIQELGGRMRVETAPGAGTVVQFRIPSSLEEVPS
jgi:signal transduction histidine kinase